MTQDVFKIYVDQLRDGEVESIMEALPPDFLDIHEKELEFPEAISLQGEAYLTQDSLMLRLSMATMAYMPCSICNEKVAVGLKLKDFYHSELLSDIKSGVYDFSEILREAVLLEVPQFVECHKGKCPKRGEIKKYLKESESGKEDLDEGYQPFADLSFENLEKLKKTQKKKL